jgi:hypothetical protein
MARLDGVAKRNASVCVGNRTFVMQVLEFGTQFAQFFVSFNPLSITGCKKTPEGQPTFGNFR